MKLQDLVFVFWFLLVFSQRSELLSLISGIFCFLLAIFSFSFRFLFTAERLTWYGTAFLSLALVQQTKKLAQKK